MFDAWGGHPFRAARVRFGGNLSPHGGDPRALFWPRLTRPAEHQAALQGSGRGPTVLTHRQTQIVVHLRQERHGGLSEPFPCHVGKNNENDVIEHVLFGKKKSFWMSLDYETRSTSDIYVLN